MLCKTYFIACIDKNSLSIKVRCTSKCKKKKIKIKKNKIKNCEAPKFTFQRAVPNEYYVCVKNLYLFALILLAVGAYSFSILTGCMYQRSYVCFLWAMDYFKKVSPLCLLVQGIAF
jgi:hypothetical protein